ncbi:MAG TPA: hypothetical protein VG096_11710 [Bryobacteraceae bacterium]|jgi:hypothetical protein|nr:hypothetical protein [Bryobacteraceae bacterium]
MKLDRRDLLLSGPAAFLGFQLAESLRAQAQNAAPVDNDVVNFWVRGMGVPANTIVGGERTRGRQTGPTVSDYGREPLFLHHDPDTDSLITTDQIPTQKLLPAGATDVSFQLVRMRLNAADDQKFKDYSSGGIYVDLQQAPAPQTSVLQDVETLASSVFSAIFPQGGAKSSGGKSGGGKSSGGGKTGAKGNSFFAPQAAASSPAGGAAVPLQQAKQAQSITLPNGVGRTSFACFAKDRKKTLFGKFVDVFGELAASPMLSYLPMLSLPAVGASTLNAVRSLVGNLQAHGQNQQWILMSPPLDVTTTAQGLQNAPDAVRLRPGNYVAIPKEQSDAIKNQLAKLKVLDGFLVPKEATALDVYDAYPTAAPGVSYITLSVGVQPSKKKAG